ncbi:TPA: hypothetical protein SCS19_004137 [Enterobacter kobei]|uniref:hypothetical protein n=1 Tax=Enterobacter kobei TaxID=208224 RepID=UPI0018A48862|nr:hypothetical protein [Enterobacter kobei]MBG0684022.1 hypothetical protein [Enterobacter kobei]BBW23144.1 hypothetical protein STN0717ENT53_34790 [Enterobacter kobei]HDT4926575.1 hypothetical protein [Enterobacter kobei]HEG2054148.1 hypothetical protein [Enterobacter kobei]
MIVCELIKPGNFIAHEDREYSRKFDNLIRHLETAFYEANVSLNLFIKEYNNVDNFSFGYDEALAELQKRRDLQTLVRSELGIDSFEEVNFEVDKRLKRERWREGVMPESHQHCLLFVFAKSFLYALDAICRFIKVISEEHGAPVQIKDLYARINDSLPNLRAVRNSSQHLDERVRGKSNHGKKLEPKGVSNEAFNLPTGALVLDSLNGSKFGTTMADGHYGEVDVSLETLLIIRDILQEVINSFQWNGMKELLPR